MYRLCDLRIHNDIMEIKEEKFQKGKDQRKD